MPTMTEYKPGTFSWVDLSTSDPVAAKKFYGELFGWTSEDFPMPQGGAYSMMRKDGQDAAAISGQMNPGAPPVWNSYVTVADVNAATEKAKAVGGNVVMGPMDVMDAGRMSVVQDPTGAYFSIWQPTKHIGAGIVNDVGSFGWNELLTTDTSKASKFYGDLFGWTWDESPMPNGTSYTTIKNGDNMNGGMMAIDPAWGPMPSNWMVYFTVADCDAALENIKSLGGRVVMGPMDVPGTGRFATCQDPQGAHFNVISMAPQA